MIRYCTVSLLILSLFSIERVVASDSINIAIPYGVRSFENFDDPIVKVILENVAPGLTTSSSDGLVSPRLARSIESSSEGREWALSLQNSLSFPDGRPVTASDVQRSLSALQQFFDTGLNHRSISVRRDKQTEQILFKLENPDSHLPNVLSRLPLFDPDLMESARGAFLTGSFISGAGPYVVARNSASEIELNSSSYYFAPGLPTTKKIVLRTFPNDLAALTALRTGSVELVLLPSKEVLRLASEDSTLAIRGISAFARSNGPSTYWNSLGREDIAFDKFVTRCTLSVDSDFSERAELRNLFVP